LGEYKVHAYEYTTNSQGADHLSGGSAFSKNVNPLDPGIRSRRSIRIKDFDYSAPGAYFVTICAERRECLFGQVRDAAVRLTDAGEMIAAEWRELPRRFPFVELDVFQVMPNHVHGVLFLGCRGESCIRPKESGEHEVRPYGTLPGSLARVIQAFKSITTSRYIAGVRSRGWEPFVRKVWQRNYYEHVIRNESDLADIRDYIGENPARWAEDEYNPAK